jgi:putative PIN family toxin of toxin-antitoxin system
VRFFLDSNVLVSGIVYSGPERSILLAGFRGEHRLVVSEDVRQEALDVVRRQFPRFRKDAEEAMSILHLEAVPRKAYAGQSREFPGLRDPSDAHVLAAAIAARCDAVVTGDRDLLVLGEVKGMKILRPSQARRLVAPSR